MYVYRVESDLCNDLCLIEIGNSYQSYEQNIEPKIELGLISLFKNLMYTSVILELFPMWAIFRESIEI